MILLMLLRIDSMFFEFIDRFSVLYFGIEGGLFLDGFILFSIINSGLSSD